MSRYPGLAVFAVLLVALTGGGDLRSDHRAERAAVKAPGVGRAKWYSQFDPRQYDDPNPHVVSIIYLRPVSAGDHDPVP